MQVNDIVLAGFLGRDAEIFTIPQGGMIVSMSIAHTNKYKGKNGLVETTTWVPVKVFEPWANSAKDYRKGDNIMVIGSLSENKWTDKQTGKERSKLEVKARSICKISRQEASDNSYKESGAAATAFKADEPSDFASNDIPF